MEPKLQITKLDAAKRQIETAIALFFNYGDSVSIHTLTAAAHNVLRNLAEKVGYKEHIVKNEILIPDTLKKRYFEKVNEAENFFKHADADHDKVLEFRPELTTIFLFDAIRMYQKLTGEYPTFMGKFVAWFYIKNPDAISPAFKPLIDKAIELGASADDRKFFLNLSI